MRDDGPVVDDVEIGRAVEALRAGGLVGLPTETVYGLAGDAGSDAAVRRIFAAKGRPADHPLIVHLGAGVDPADGWASGPVDGLDRLQALWPGPLSVVVPAGPRISALVTGGRDTVALRVPDHPVALAVLAAFGGGLAAPSANRFGRVSPTTAADVIDELGDAVDVVLDGGPCAVGVESTIVELTGPVPMILRPGGVPAELVEEVLGLPVARAATGPSRAPGMLAAHYAPAAQVELVDGPALRDRAAELAEGGVRVGALVAPAEPLPDGVVRLDGSTDVVESARILYRRLRDADAAGLDVVVVAVPAGTGGLADAVTDRLRRAAAGSAATGQPAVQPSRPSRP